MIRILLADDHAIIRDGLRQIFAETGDLQVAGEAASGHEVLARVREADWDILLLDLSMPGKSGLELIKQIKTEKPRLPILVLSMHEPEQYAQRALRAGAAGYLNKDSAAAELVEAVRRVAAGGRYISAALAQLLAEQIGMDAAREPHERLSGREFQVFRLLAAGSTVGEIAERLHLSVNTVSTYRSRVLEKLGAANNAELMRYAAERRLV